MQELTVEMYFLRESEAFQDPGQLHDYATVQTPLKSDWGTVNWGSVWLIP